MTLLHLSLTTPSRVCDKCAAELGPDADDDGVLDPSPVSPSAASNAVSASTSSQGANSTGSSSSYAAGRSVSTRPSASSVASSGRGGFNNNNGMTVSGGASKDWPALLGVLEVPAWTYAVKPFVPHGSNIRIGRVLLKIVSARNLPCPRSKASSTSSGRRTVDFEAPGNGPDSTVTAAPSAPLNNFTFTALTRLGSQASRTNPVTPSAFSSIQINPSKTGRSHSSLAAGGTGRAGDAASSVPVCEAAWHESIVMDVASGNEVFEIQVLRSHNSRPGYASGTTSNFTVGTATLPLKQLAHQKRVAMWLPLEIGGSAASASSSSSSSSLKSSTISGLQSDPGAAAGSGGLDASLDDSPAICIEAQYIYNSLGRFWSQLLPHQQDVDPIAGRQFSFSRFYRDFLFFILQIHSLFWFLDSASPVIGWRSPLVSFLTVAVGIYLVYNPWAVLVLLHIFLIRYILLRYLELRVTAGGSSTPGSPVSLSQLSDITPQDVEILASTCPDDPPAVLGGAQDGYSSSRDVVASTGLRLGTSGAGSAADRSSIPPLKVGPNPSPEDADAALINLLSGMLDRLLPLSGANMSLAQYDRALAYSSATLHRIRRLLSWSNAGATAAILLYAIVGLVWSLWFSQSSLWLGLGLAVMLLRTSPMIFLGKAIGGLGRMIFSA